MSTLHRTLTATMAGLAVAAVALAGATPASAASAPPTPVIGAPSSTSDYYVHNGQLFLSGVAEGDIYSSLFSFNGTTFTQVPGSPVGPTQFHTLGDELIFEAIVDISAVPYAYGLFTYDGTTITQVPGPFESPNDFVSTGGVAYFQATVGGVAELWQYDGSAASPVAGGTVGPRYLSTYNGKLYFEGDTDPTPGEARTLFSYDPETPGTPAAPVAGAPVGASELVAYDGLAYFGADGSFYSFDGASTFTVVDLMPAASASALTVFDGALYFTGGTSGFGNVFSFKGGTVTEVPGAVTETGRYTEYNGSLYYLGFANDLPVMNLITAGQVSVLEGSPQYTFNMTVFQGKLYFSGDTDDASNVMYVYETEPPSPAPAGPALASTGLDSGMPALGALVLLLAGASVVLLARARRA
ncbi:hypothetical protein HDC94_001044 [Leifsonia sp. AK011]|uniref:hypothetical protein n=1 Tax=Leifsonia sp. AK011 TaxID=2723075 RepID=UPI0015C6E0F1|nr:hypothetical protein [Leifsonia sp. AK011]NYF09888.1 hypothetical protein [Leifsonia sp. AK011]